MQLKNVRKYKAYVILCICMLIQIAEVMPHHHHASSFCIRADLETTVHGYCLHYAHPSEDPHQHSCDADCITHFQYYTSSNAFQNSVPAFLCFVFPACILISFLRVILQEEPFEVVLRMRYKERLYLQYVKRSTGLRAPPVL